MKIRSALKLPREHGAWAMLYVPLVLGLCVAGRVNVPAILLLVSATMMFIARESLLVWWRAQKRQRPTPSSREAGRLLLVYLSLAALAGLPLLLVYQLKWLLPLAFISGLFLLINGWQATAFEERTMSSELMAIVGLTMTAPASYYAARGQWHMTNFWLWGLSAGYFASSVFYVKLRVTWLHAKREEDKKRAWWFCFFYHAFLLAGLSATAFTRSLPLFGLIAFMPILLRTAYTLLKPAQPLNLNLKRIGMAELAYSAIFLIFITLTFRLPF